MKEMDTTFLMLFAGAVSIIMFILHYNTQTMLTILLGVLVGFYIVGSMFKWMLDVFEQQNVVVEAENAEESEMTEETASDMDEGQVKMES